MHSAPPEHISAKGRDILRTGDWRAVAHMRRRKADNRCMCVIGAGCDRVGRSAKARCLATLPVGGTYLPYARTVAGRAREATPLTCSTTVHVGRSGILAV